MQEVSIKYQIPKFGADLVEVFLEKRPHNKSLLHAATVYFDTIQDYPKSIEYAQRMYENSQALSTKVFANYLHLFCSLKAGFWQDSQDLINRNSELLGQLFLEEKEQILEPLAVRGFINIGTVLPYLGDWAKENRQYTNLVSQISYQYYCENYTESPVTPKQHEKLRIGYLAETFRRHSVGWLSRWLFKYHDREQFTIAIYLLGANHEDELTEKFFQPHADIYRYLDTSPENVAEQIREDEIDILVELDSLTSNLACRILSLKPAPIQVTWLGYDATGLPTVDYFIADPYALPLNAQEYYQEKIWRLPQTYLAVDGFEVDIPTMSRRQLGIPEDGIVYFSVQNALKRHPDMIRTQMAILKNVENSYFLIKGCEGKPKAMELFRQIAVEEGVDPAILYFLPQDREEAQHRANLRLADVALDTYPYSGATTTLEVLWMEIPLVTRVGEQFLSRNSYAFMLNAGISAGIAHSDAEYIDWGIRLGRDRELRSQIAWQLHAAKSHAPIWNTPAFVKELEQAYKKMHQDHDNCKDSDYNVG
jgi:predicted O-linked N-acetylglucosamine transferase (SPINDLY family)